MESTWGFVIFLWAVLIAIMAVLFIQELKKTPEQRKYERKMMRESLKNDRQLRKIVEVTPLGVSGLQFKRGGFRGALLGGFIGGVPGAVVGAALRSGNGVLVESFAVKYGSGEVVIRECMQGSSEYNALMKYVKNDI